MTAVGRAIRRRFGISAPRVAVRRQLPWYWSALAAATLAGLMWFAAWVVFRSSGDLVGESDVAAEVSALRARVVALDEENRRLRQAVAGGERQIQIEAATHETIARQGRQLAAENAALREDLAFFQSIASRPADGGVALNRFEVEPGVLAGEYRFRLLVVQPREHGRDFKGRLRLAVEVEQDGARKSLALPAAEEAAPSWRLDFRFFQRVEGSFSIPAGATVKRVEALVLEDGVSAARTSRTFNF